MKRKNPRRVPAIILRKCKRFGPFAHSMRDRILAERRKQGSK